MLRLMLVTVLCAVLIALPVDARLGAGEKAPDFKATTLDGKNVGLSDYKGNYLFLNFYATW